MAAKVSIEAFKDAAHSFKKIKQPEYLSGSFFVFCLHPLSSPFVFIVGCAALLLFVGKQNGYSKKKKTELEKYYLKNFL